MKIISSLAVILLGIQSLCVGVCLGMDVPLSMGMPPCHGGALPNSDDRYAKIDPCIDRQAVETKSLSTLDHVVLPVESHLHVVVVDLAPPVLESLSVPSESPIPPSLGLVLRI